MHDVAAVLPDNVVALFARNANADDPRIVSVPLGLPREAPPRLAAALAADPPADPSRRKLAHAKFRLRYERPKLERGRRQAAAVVRTKPWIDQDLRRKQLPPDKYYRALLEHRFVISPEGCAAILWSDRAKAPEAAEAMKLTATDIAKFGVVDEVLEEPMGGAHWDPEATGAVVRQAVARQLERLESLTERELLDKRLEKYLRMGVVIEE